MAEKPIEITIPSDAIECNDFAKIICSTHSGECRNCPHDGLGAVTTPECLDMLTSRIFNRGLILTIKGTETSDDPKH